MKAENEIKYFLELWKIKDWSVDFHTVRGRRYPSAAIYPDLKVIEINGTLTTLARWGLIEILLHELTHAKLKEEGYVDWDKHDSHFWETYMELRKDFEDLVDVYWD